ncbi:MAG TPA: hypothetical protein DCE42_23865 [Myxococcales bacterium]|nr:hypothetical protein [Deltaproteobacteria bacterium]MBU51653.1 hypothetical protein [Deltaproteobacteria bacterium]HAA57824.1 hypothetical protein [Myxococcales bacterium]|tara:strand:+ start:9768 stop:10163 length:396 start_codon:yes stop_codon:yes gene_type:complete
MFEKPRREAPSIGLTPLIDIVFILLIFVVLAANFDRVKGLKVALPQASNTQAPEKKILAITVTKEGKLMYEDKTLSKSQLLPKLKELRKKHSILLLRADNKVALQHAVYVLDQASSAGFESVSIAANRPSK